MTSATSAAPGAASTSSARTVVGSLEFGIEHNGCLHYEFEMRLPTVGDNIEALLRHGSESAMRVGLEMYARSLVRLGTIPTDQITYELLAAGLVDDDYDVIEGAAQELKKKQKRSSDNSVSSGPS